MILDVISNLENYRQLFPRFEAYKEYLIILNELAEANKTWEKANSFQSCQAKPESWRMLSTSSIKNILICK